ncbi:retrovirus-related pol polyprotein from transposon RE1 [Tanacetum coccineum]
MLFNAHIPASYWVDAFSSATFIINRLPTPLLDQKSPFQLLFNQVPNYDNFRAYGCQVFPYLPDYSPHKLAPRSISCVFIGYSPQHKGYRCLDPVTPRIFVTRHARFNEKVFPFIGSSGDINIRNLELTTFLQDTPPTLDSSSNPPQCPPNTTSSTNGPSVCTLCRPSPTFHSAPGSPLSNPSTTQHSSPSHDATSALDTPLVHETSPPHVPSSTYVSPPANSAQQPDPPIELTSTTSNLQQPSSSTTTHPMTTRSKSGIIKTKHIADLASLTTHPLHIALSSITEPRGFKTASKDPKWMGAMIEELQALQQNKTWTLVPRPQPTNIGGSKWVYRVKYNSDGTIERYKACLVAQGYT